MATGYVGLGGEVAARDESGRDGIAEDARRMRGGLANEVVGKLPIKSRIAF
jgi:hypothetical protein